MEVGPAIESAAPAAWQDGSGAPPGSAGDKRTARRRATLFGTRYREPRVLVRRFRGCLDEISGRSSRLLVLRYGIGSFEPRPAAMVARRLGISRRQYVHQRGRALRRLAVAARRSGCERERLTVAVAESAVQPVSAVSWPASDAGVTLVSSGGTSPPAASRGDVLGRSDSKADDEDDKAAANRPFGSPTLDLASPSRDIPFLIALASLVALFAWLVIRRTRRATDRLEDPSRVSRMRR